MNPFRGVFVSAVTPHQRQGHQVDLGAMLDLVDFLCAGGVEGVAVLGATGEYPHFTIEDRIRTVQFVAKRSTVPVLAGVSHSTLDGAVSLALEAAGAGVAGVLAAPPHYYPYGQEEIREFYLRLAEAVSGAVPVLLHNLPVFTNAIHEKTVDELLATGVFAGLADAGGDAAVLGRMASAHGDLAFLCASDGAIPACAEAGVEAVLSSVGCAAPELVMALHRVLRLRLPEKTAQLTARLHEFLDWADSFPAPAAIKEATAARGLKVGPAAVPLPPAGAARREAFLAWFAAWLPEVRREALEE